MRNECWERKKRSKTMRKKKASVWVTGIRARKILEITFALRTYIVANKNLKFISQSYLSLPWSILWEKKRWFEWWRRKDCSTQFREYILVFDLLRHPHTLQNMFFIRLFLLFFCSFMLRGTKIICPNSWSIFKIHEIRIFNHIYKWIDRKGCCPLKL